MTLVPAPDSRSKKPNWPWIILCITVGLAAIYLAWQLIVPNPDNNAMPAFWSAVLINVGTTVLLAGILFVLERRFVKDTRAVATEVATAAATQAVEQTIDLNTDLSTRLFDLEERFQGQLAEQTKNHDDTLKALSLDASYESVLLNLKTAFDLGAITREGLTVPAGKNEKSPRVTFIFQPAFFNEYGENRDEQIKLEYIADMKPSDIGRPIISENWNVDEDPVEVFRRLTDAMVRAGYGRDKPLLKIGDAFANLATTLQDAVSARRGDVSWQSGGSVLEQIADGWVITENGVETRDHGIVVSPDQLRQPFSIVERQAWQPPAKPEWAESDLWETALQRGFRDGHSMW